MIRLENIAKEYHKHGVTIHALRGVSLHAAPGTITLVRGHSGSGKTTLIDIIAGLTRPTSGKVFVAGECLGNMGPARLSKLRARHVAVVFQLFHLIPYLTAEENVLLPTLAAPVQDSRQRAQALLERLGIADRARHYPAEMSAGERQRCALARALLQRPQVILADEPTGNLDEESAGWVLDSLDVCRQEGAAVLVASHQHLERIRADQEFDLKEGAFADRSTSSEK